MLIIFSDRAHDYWIRPDLELTKIHRWSPNNWFLVVCLMKRQTRGLAWWGAQADVPIAIRITTERPWVGRMSSLPPNASPTLCPGCCGIKWGNFLAVDVSCSVTKWQWCAAKAVALIAFMAALPGMHSLSVTAQSITGAQPQWSVCDASHLEQNFGLASVQLQVSWTNASRMVQSVAIKER